MIHCEECGYENIDFEELGSGEDDSEDGSGEFTDYICPECGYMNRVYDYGTNNNI